MTTREKAGAWWESWSKPVAAAVVGMILGAGSLALAITPMVEQHEKQIADQAAEIRVLSEKVHKIGEDVAVTRAVVERIEHNADRR